MYTTQEAVYSWRLSSKSLSIHSLTSKTISLTCKTYNIKKALFQPPIKDLPLRTSMPPKQGVRWPMELAEAAYILPCKLPTHPPSIPCSICVRVCRSLQPLELESNPPILNPLRDFSQRKEIPRFFCINQLKEFNTEVYIL